MNFSNFNLGKRVANFETSEAFDAYTRIDIVLGEDEQGNAITVSYPVPTEENDYSSGRIMTVDMPMCTDTALALNAAQRIYDSLSSADDESQTAYQYQPMQADDALADPSMEFGDSVDINNVHSGFFVRSVSFGRLMKTQLSAPTDEEIDHEYPYQTAQQRQITRNTKELKAGIYASAEAIRIEAEQREQDVGDLRSELEVTASAIRAEVVSKEGGETSTFGWKLLASEFGLYANGQKVFWVNKDGANIKGTLQVGTSVGSSNGFVISANAIYKGISKFGGTQSTGVYIGTDGIQLGKNFKVDSSGNLTAASGTFTGNIYAKNIQYGGSAGTFSGSGITGGSVSTAQMNSYASGGISAGYSADTFTKQASDINIGVRILKAAALIGNTLSVAGYQATWQTRSVKGAGGYDITINYLGY